MCIRKEVVPDLLVIGTTTEVKKVDCDFIAGNGDFLDTVIDSDCGDILLDKPALTVAFNDAGFSGFLVAY